MNAKAHMYDIWYGPPGDKRELLRYGPVPLYAHRVAVLLGEWNLADKGKREWFAERASPAYLEYILRHKDCPWEGMEREIAEADVREARERGEL